MPEDFADDVAFQAPNDLALAIAFDGAFGNVALCSFMIPHSDDGDAVECGIGLSVTAPVEVPCGWFCRLRPGSGKPRRAWPVRPRI